MVPQHNLFCIYICLKYSHVFIDKCIISRVNWNFLLSEMCKILNRWCEWNLCFCRTVNISCTSLWNLRKNHAQHWERKKSLLSFVLTKLKQNFSFMIPDKSIWFNLWSLYCSHVSFYYWRLTDHLGDPFLIRSAITSPKCWQVPPVSASCSFCKIFNGWNGIKCQIQWCWVGWRYENNVQNRHHWKKNVTFDYIYNLKYFVMMLI